MTLTHEEEVHSSSAIFGDLGLILILFLYRIGHEGISVTCSPIGEEVISVTCAPIGQEEPRRLP